MVGIIRILFAGLLLTASASVCAKDVKHGQLPSPLFEALVACKSVADNGGRLACLDTAVANLEKAVAASDIYIVDKAEVRETRKSLFGFSVAGLAKVFGGGDHDEDEFSTIKSTITRAEDRGYGKWAFTLPDGAIWETTELVRLSPRKNDAIEIKKGMGGGYFLKVGSSSYQIRARRIK